MHDYVENTLMFYDANVQEYIKKTRHLSPAIYMKRFMNLLPKKGRILDVGCGFGRDVKIFLKERFYAEGIDISPHMISAARTYAPGAAFRCKNILVEDIGNEYYDGIWCNALLVHIAKSDAPRVINKMFSALCKGGTIFVGVKKGIGEGYVCDERYGGDKKFFVKYNVKEIHFLLSEEGFVDIEIESVEFSNDYSDDALHVFARKP